MRPSPVSSQDLFCSLPRNQSWDVTLRLGVSVIIEFFSFRVNDLCELEFSDVLVVKQKFCFERACYCLKRLNN